MHRRIKIKVIIKNEHCISERIIGEDIRINYRLDTI